MHVEFGQKSEKKLTTTIKTPCFLEKDSAVLTRVAGVSTA